MKQLIKNIALKMTGRDLSRMPLYHHDVRPDFKNIYANLTLQTLIDQFQTVLDIGSGAGKHAEILRKYGKTVTQLDFGKSIYYQGKADNSKVLYTDYSIHEFDSQFDCLWASHVLEHQPNVNRFLVKMRADLKEGGILAITVPPLKHQIVGGHLNLWNAGLLLYHLVFAGFNCRNAHVRTYGYNVSVILRKEAIDLPPIDYDSGDIDRLSDFFPAGCQENFNGDIRLLNWPWK